MFLKRIYIVVVAVVTLFSLSASSVFAGYVFNKNLRLGDTDIDVKELQMFLNTDEMTRVASEGPGSAGNETTYFGPATARAVALFQNKYAEEILAPFGLMFGTGILGSGTRAKINTLLQTPAQTSVYTQTPASVTYTAPHSPSSPALTPATLQDVSNISQFNLFTEADNDKVQLAFVSLNSGPVGSTFEITGTGFLPTGNKVHFGNHVVSNVPSVNANKMMVTIPESVPPGVHDLEVSNTKGKSESISYFIVTAPGGSAPTITSATPTTAKLGDTITITGENFMSTGNIVHSSLGTFDNLPSVDGKTIKVVLQAPDHLTDLELLFEIDETFELKVYMTVATLYGESSKYAPAIVTLQ